MKLLSTSKASFHVFDSNNSGSLEKGELKRKIRAVIRGKRFSSSISEHYNEILDKEIDEVVDQIFDLVDTDKSGTIELEEFVEGFTHNKDVSGIIDKIIEHINASDSK